MPRFITIQQAIDHLRLDLEIGDSPVDPEEAHLELKVDAAEAVYVNYLKKNDDSPPWEPSEAELPIVQACVLLLLTGLWDDREGSGVGDYLKPNGAVALLSARLRDPAIA
jgi:hypothetical protein